MSKHEVVVEFDISIAEYVIAFPASFCVEANLREGDAFTCELSDDGCSIILTPKTNK